MARLDARASGIDPPQSAAADNARVLVHESHHRIKNNLQIVAGLLAMQARTSGDARVREPLMAAYRRVLAVARVHERLQRAGEGETVTMPPFLDGLCRDLQQGLGGPEVVRFTIETEAAELPTSTVTTLALVINELVTNAVKHAYADGPGEVRVRLRNEYPGWRLTVSDDGPGLAVRSPASQGDGLDLLNLLTLQIRGSLTTDPSPRGTSISLWFA